MTDTAQPLAAAEPQVASRDDAIADAAEAFKISLGQIEPEPAVDAPVAAAPDPADQDDDIEAPEAADPAGDGAESLDGDDDPDAAADDAQPDAVDLPRSWPADKAELWTSLPPEAQAVIAEREGQRDAAVTRALVIALALLSAGCARGERPEPRIRTVEVHVPVPQPCDAASRLGAAPTYPDSDEALKDSPTLFQQVRLLLAGRLLRIARGAALEHAMASCSR